MTIRPFEEHKPVIHSTAYIDESAVVIGNVTIGKKSSVWPLSVIRGDIQTITIGEKTNIQDGSILHVTHASPFSKQEEGYPLFIGNQVTVGHKAILHGCTIEDNCLIGMGAIVLDGATIKTGAMVGAGSLIPPGKVLESGYMWLGSPAKKIRKLTDKEQEFFTYSSQHYYDLAQRTNT